jgi:hypothetical protein
MPRRVHGLVERFYFGEAAGRQVTVREEGTKLPLAVRADLRKHSSAFAWGASADPGCAQLALALLANALGDDAGALRFQEAFRRRVVERLPERWTITRSRILAHVDLLEYQMRATSAAGAGAIGRVA